MSVLALIPARSGSKGVPGKNIRLLAGKPLITHTIDAALASRGIDRVVVSTDCPRIASVSLQAGAEVPFLRPQALAEDQTPMVAVVQHTLAALGQGGWTPRLVVLLQPTSPLRTAHHIEEALTIFRSSTADSLAGVTLAQQSPFWMQQVDDTGFLRPVLKGPTFDRRQDLPPVYVLNGAIYITTPSLAARGQILGSRVLPYIMDVEDSVDIDTEGDLQLASALINRRRQGEGVVP